MGAWKAPEPGDIVWCRFPHLPRRTPGPKPRPALVCSVTHRTDGVSVSVAYGTSQGLSNLRGGEFAITRQEHPAAYSSAGLSYDTKFDLRQQVELPWTEDFFAVPPRSPHGQSPKLGVLHASMMRAAQAAFRTLVAEG
jgi:hypothetical protein